MIDHGADGDADNPGRPRNGTVARVAALLVAAMLLGAGLWAVVRSDGGVRSGVSIASPEQQVTVPHSPAAPVSSEAADPSHSAGSSEATPTPTPGRVSDPASLPTSDLGPVAPETVVLRHQPGQRSWSATSAGISITVTASTSHPVAGEPVRFAVSASAAGPCCGLTIVYGDGPVDDNQEDGGCPTGPTSTEFEHVYARSGNYTLLVSASQLGCADPSQIGSVRIPFPVGGSSVAAGGQGPSLPSVNADSTLREGIVPVYDTAWVTLYAAAVDRDGWLRKLVVDWGDGTPLLTHVTSEPCDQLPRGWPNETRVMLPDRPPFTHQFAQAGAHKITVTAYSTGCDGSTPQHGSGSFTWISAPHDDAPTVTPSITPAP
jgi:hypothetical protein